MLYFEIRFKYLDFRDETKKNMLLKICNNKED